ncbi:TMhelix containing protein [Vibrio phage 2.275.O._10N.286.54.E11]|nr:TMhelix containing protein [Vibrio phage 2.275.O._10N.286.54.E11]
MKKIILTVLAIPIASASIYAAPEVLMMDENAFTGSTIAMYDFETNECSIVHTNNDGVLNSIVNVRANKDINIVIPGDFSGTTRVVSKYIQEVDYSSFIREASDEYLTISYNHKNPTLNTEFVMNSMNSFGSFTVYQDMKAKVHKAKFSSDVRDVFYNCVSTITKSEL